MTHPPSEQAIAENPSSPRPDAVETPPTAENPSFGWNRYAERINGRFAMIGFVALLLTEVITRQDFFTWIGLR
ncbi:MAG: high light inducible protein [Leptolyngbya foveolarum]|uniref:High light inducible protein n=1 Tax=Leptolyngbya foveolarum TaxID=47253 RepID=A0A2W4WUI9_9CYAN|nr:MAG: high light inducible protein [Leptolyngbya foveolarum]